MSRFMRLSIVTLAALTIAGLALAGQAQAAAAESSLTDGAAAGPPGSSTPSDLWVSATTGDDRNRCLRSQEPCLTIQSAVDKIPAIVDQNVVVHISAGIYGGNIFLGDRISPKRSGITLRGEPGVVIDGTGGAEAGLVISNISSVAVENFEIRGFTQDGIVLDRARQVQILSSRIVGNGQEGLRAEESSGSIIESIVEQNGVDGIYCSGGALTIGHSQSARPGLPRLPARSADQDGQDPGASLPPLLSVSERPPGGVIIASNGGRGIMASACSVQFGGWAEISGNAGGLAAAHGGVIDFGGRNDVDVRNNVQFQLMSGCAGMVCRYANSPVDGECQSFNYGTCSP